METQQKPFKIYKSSAGSGKTYTLVLSFLSIILKDADLDKFKKILAITFTNKASKEMKERILDGLDKLKNASDKSFTTTYSKATGLSEEVLQSKAQALFTRILHNYGQLNILTIDKFVHKLIRSFSRELGLTTNFELETNVDEFIQRCIDELLESVGDDPQLTSTLINYSKDLVDDDQLINIQYALESQAKLLKTEEGGLALEVYKDMNLDDFEEIKKNLHVKIKTLRESLKQQAQKIVNLLSGFDILDLKFGATTSLGVPLKAIMDNEKNVPFTEAQIRNCQNEKWLAKPKDKDKIAFYEHIQSISEELSTEFLLLFKLVKQEKLLHEVDKKLVAFSLLNNIKQLLKKVKQENNIVFISDFNEIISEVIKNEPTPYIYEKMGNKFSHYFIDEFQDTSVLQWNNLIPLVYDSLATQQENLIVGDAKQSIYRWRGGDASQFINLPKVNADIADIQFINRSFHLNADVKSLQTNYRSSESIIDFNNWLFESLLKEYAEFPMLKSIYEDVHQEKNRKEIGFVKVQVYRELKEKNGIQITEEDIRQNDPLEILLQDINNCIKDQFNYGDICILVRSNRQGAEIANFLKENDISVTSQDSLLLSESTPVLSIISLIKVIQNPNDENAINTFKYNHLNKSIIQLFEEYRIPNKKNNFYNEGFDVKKYIKNTIPNFDENYYNALAIYDKVDYLIPLLGFSRNNIFMDKLLNFTFDFQQKNGHNVNYFLEHFELKKDKISVSPPDSTSSVKVMTIHKSKGLQFPIVMIPLKLESNDTDATWIQDDTLGEIGLENFALNLKDELLTDELKEKKSQIDELKNLDSTNVLYVALTRAEDRMYLNLKKAPDKPSSLSFPAHLEKIVSMHPKYDNEKFKLTLGELKSKVVNNTEVVEKTSNEIDQYTNWRSTLELSISPKTQQEDLDDFLEMEWGKVIHEILQFVNDTSMVDNAIERFLRKNTNWRQEEKILQSIFAHFKSNETVQQILNNGSLYLSERSLLSKDGIEIRPDKIVEKDNEIILIDFKTGSPKKSHIKQIEQYMESLQELYKKPIQMYLIYLSTEKTIVQHV